MKKLTLTGISILLSVIFLLPITALAGGSSDTCDTKYPIVLAHGMGFSATVFGAIDYWWGIPDELEDEGADVFITSVNGMDSTRNKAIDFKNQFLQIKAATGASKLNIIAHSHGTLYTRDAISNLGLSGYVASHTSIAGPHRGSALADMVVGIVPNSMEWLVGDTMDLVYIFLMGDSNPNSLANAYDITRPYMINTFNPNTPNKSGVYYQSWAAKAKTSCPSIILEATWLVMLAAEGANDGLVSVNSAKWGNFRGVQDAAWYSVGCDHANIVDQLFGITPGFDAPGFYVDIASDLKSRGY